MESEFLNCALSSPPEASRLAFVGWSGTLVSGAWALFFSFSDTCCGFVSEVCGFNCAVLLRSCAPAVGMAMTIEKSATTSRSLQTPFLVPITSSPRNRRLGRRLEDRSYDLVHKRVHIWLQSGLCPRHFGLEGLTSRLNPRVSGLPSFRQLRGVRFKLLASPQFLGFVDGKLDVSDPLLVLGASRFCSGNVRARLFRGAFCAFAALR